jgi:chromosome segregation ATPase
VVETLCYLQLQEQLIQQFYIWQSTATKLKKTEGVISFLKKQLEAKEESLKSSNQKQEELQTAIIVLTQTVQSLNQTVQRLCAQPKDVSRC